MEVFPHCAFGFIANENGGFVQPVCAACCKNLDFIPHGNCHHPRTLLQGLWFIVWVSRAPLRKDKSCLLLAWATWHAGFAGRVNFWKIFPHFAVVAW